MGRLTRRQWVKHLDKLSAQFKKERENREAGQLSLPRLFGQESPIRKVTKHVRRPLTQARRKIQTSLNFTAKAEKCSRRPPVQRCTGASSWFPPVQRCTGASSWRPPVQRCTGDSTVTRVISPSPRKRQNVKDQVSAIPPAATRPVGLRSGGTGLTCPIARIGPTRHSGERILDVDTNT
jgi:hypothetical protein